MTKDANQKEYDRVTEELNRTHGLDRDKDKTPMFPPSCPHCGSLKMTQVLFSSHRQECLDCHQGYYLKKLEEELPEKPNVVKLTEGEWRIFLELSDGACDEMSNHGCNDFNLKVHIPDLEDRKKLVKAMRQWNGDPEIYEEDVKSGRDFGWISDHFVFGYLVHKLKVQAGLE